MDADFGPRDLVTEDRAAKRDFAGGERAALAGLHTVLFFHERQCGGEKAARPVTGPQWQRSGGSDIERS